MIAKYPNLELLVYKAKQIYKHGISGSMHDGERTPVMQNAKLLDEEVFAFRQTWDTTATGFDLDGGVSGQAFTNAYTTVVQIDFEAENQDPEVGVERNYFFAVFFGDALAYCGFNPNRSFYLDVSNFDMKSQRKQDYFN